MPAPAGAQALREVLVNTYLTNPQIEADRARQRALDDDVARALGGWRPQAVLTAEQGRGHDVQDFHATTQPFPQAAYTIHEYRTPETLLLQIQQSIYDGGRTSADVRHSEIVVESGLAQMVSVEQGVLGQATQAYYDLYRDQSILALARQNVTWLEDQVKATHARYAVKDVTQTDVAQAEARLAGAQSDLTTAEGTVATSRSAFIAATGIEPGQLPAPPPPPRDRLPAALADAQRLAQSSPDLRAAILAARAAEADVDSVASGLSPTLALRGTSRRLSQSDEANLTRTDNEVVLSLSIPLYEGGVYAARTRGAKQVAGQRRLEIDQARRRAVDQVNRAWAQLMSAQASIRSLTEQVRAAQVANKGMEKELRAGTRTVYDQLNAQQEEMNAKIGLLRSQHDEVVASYALLVAVGGLTASNLGLPVQVYDPSVHYEKVRNTWFGTGIDESYETPPMAD